MSKQSAIMAMGKVIAGIGAIEKNRKNTAQKYNYRGVDDVMNALQPLLVENNLILSPIYSKFKQRQEGKTFVASVRLDLYAYYTGTVEAVLNDGSWEATDRHLVATTYGTALNYGDKALYAAMSNAFKYALFQALCIPTEEEKDVEAFDVSPEPKKKAKEKKPDKADLKSLVESWSECFDNAKTKKAVEKYAVELKSMNLDKEVSEQIMPAYERAISRFQ